MAGTATFNVGQVRKLFDHSKAAATHSADYEHLFDPKFHKGGVVLCKDGSPYKDGSGWPDSNNIDTSLIPAALTLVGDHGIYLMSNGNPHLFIEEGKPANVIAYAKESDPTSDADFDTWYEAKRRIFGGDDGVESLELERFEEVMKLPDTASFKIKITRSSITVLAPTAKVYLADGVVIKTKKPIHIGSQIYVCHFRATAKSGVFVALKNDLSAVCLVKLSAALAGRLIADGDAEIISK